jgi:hypothetical protein
VLAGGGNCPGGATAAAVQAPAVGSGPGCLGGDAACYLNQPPLNLGGLLNTTVTATCLKPPTVGVPCDPTWQVQVRVDFPLAYGFFKTMMPAGTIPGTVRYQTTVASSNCP